MVEDRKLAVLRAIVEDYVSTQEPVGSKSLAERHGLAILAPSGTTEDYLNGSAYGVMGYTTDKKSVIVQHRYDLWEMPLDGSAARNLTNGTGTKNEMRFRYVRTEPLEPNLRADELFHYASSCSVSSASCAAARAISVSRGSGAAAAMPRARQSICRSRLRSRRTASTRSRPASTSWRTAS